MAHDYLTHADAAMQGGPLGATYNEIMRSRLRIRSMVLPLATLVVVALQLVRPSPVWKGLATAFGGLWLLSYFWARMLRRNLSFGRAMRFGWAQVGDRLEEQFTVINEDFLPATWLEVSDESTLPGYSVARATGVGGTSQNAWTTSGTCTRRGVFTLGNTELATGDPLGIFRVEIVDPRAATLTVMPPVIPLPFDEVAAGGWQGEGRPRLHATEQTPSAEAVREYMPGDSMRLVHWPTTARTGEPYVRVLEGAPASDWWIALDFEKRVQAGGEEESTAELGVIVAGSMADRGLRAHRGVGLVAAGEQPVWMRPEAGEKQRWKMMRALAVLQPASTALATLLERLGPALGRDANLVVITPCTEADWVTALTRLAWRGITATAILIDPGTFEAGRGANMQALGELLTQAGIAHHIIGRELLQQPEARPGPAGQWEWRVLPTGKAVPVRRPADLSWKQLK